MIEVESTNIGAHALLITQDNKLILQQRDHKPGLINSGLISLFGGTLQQGEDNLTGLIRELTEELKYDFSNSQISFLSTLYKTKALDGIDYTIHIFIINGVKFNELELIEGESLVLDTLESLLQNSNLTRITALALNKYQEHLKQVD